MDLVLCAYVRNIHLVFSIYNVCVSYLNHIMPQCEGAAFNHLLRAMSGQNSIWYV